MLYRAVTKVLHHLPARDLVCVIRPVSMSHDRRKSLMGQLTVRADRPLTPMTHWTSPATALRERPTPRVSFAPDECNPYAVWNCLGLGHWTEFSWPRLLAAH